MNNEIIIVIIVTFLAALIGASATIMTSNQKYAGCGKVLFFASIAGILGLILIVLISPAISGVLGFEPTPIEPLPTDTVFTTAPPSSTQILSTQATETATNAVTSVQELTSTPSFASTSDLFIATNTPPVVQNVVACETETLGPWMPIDGQGQNVTLVTGDGYIHADFWQPNGTIKSGYDEVSVLLEPNVTVTVIGVAGQGWKYSSGCTLDEINSQLLAHQERRRASGISIISVNLSELPTQ